MDQSCHASGKDLHLAELAVYTLANFSIPWSASDTLPEVAVSFISILSFPAL